MMSASFFSDLTGPETGVVFDPPARGNSSTIQGNIDPPAATWLWADINGRNNQVVTPADIGKYGLQTDAQTLYRLTSVSPATVWQAIQDFTKATWTWLNVTARLAEHVTAADVGKVGLQTDIYTYYQLTNPLPPVWRQVPDPTGTAPPLEFPTGASDAESFHDFFRLQIAFEDVWAELLDTRIQHQAEQLYARFDALMDVSPGAYDDTGDADRQKVFSYLGLFDPATGNTDISGIGDLQAFLAGMRTVLDLPPDAPTTTVTGGVAAELAALRTALDQTLSGCQMLLTELNRASGQPANVLHGQWDPTKWLNATSLQYDDPNAPLDLSAFGSTPRSQVFTTIQQVLDTYTVPSASGGTSTPPPPVTFPEITGLLMSLSGLLQERYRFDVFAPASINYGLLLNYRQHWVPQSYQVGNLVSTIPLAPQETRRYTTKTVVKKTRSQKEIDDGLRSGKDETSNTARQDAEIVDRAKNQTSFQTNAHGSFGNEGVYKVEGGMQANNDQGVESAQTKKDFREAVLKSAQEYRNEHRMEVTTEESRETETTTYQEIRNPNDELTVTYLFYELQRRFLVDESLYKATPVILVANDVPAPHEVDQSWLLRYDWILKRTILDKSFLPALEYLAANYTGEEVTLLTLEMAVQHQKSVVDKLSQQVFLANQSLAATTAGLTDAQDQQLNDTKTAETVSMVKSIFDPLGIFQGQKVDDGNSDRARMDFAKDTLNRAQAKVNDLTSDLKSEMTALQIAIDKYIAAATKHYGMLAEIDRLRLHVKDNIIYYMQAIWTYEPTDQRYFRLYNLEVPVFGQDSTAGIAPADDVLSMNMKGKSQRVSFPTPTYDDSILKLHQVADIDTLLGFKGNYMIFPLVDFDNYMAWYLVSQYIHFDPVAGLIAQDPDPGADLTLVDLQRAMAAIHAKDSTTFAQYASQFEEVMLRLLSDQTPRMVIVPSNSLYIEALPGTHPLLEDFKLIHRALDIKKTQAEVRKAELENLRLAGRLVNAEFGDPHIDKVVVVGQGQGVTIDAGQ